jgi:glycosyltransferase involved in cell wall biosynthesis
MGSGAHRPSLPYRFVQIGAIPRERFEAYPKLIPFRNETVYEEATFALGLVQSYRPAEFDVTVTCSYPFTNWILRRPLVLGVRPSHVFVTQNGDWPAHARNSEFRLFGCEGLVCTNPDYYERNTRRWRCALIPNGVDCQRFSPGAGEPRQFGLSSDRFIVLMVSALIPSKRVGDGILAVSKIPDAHLVVAGDGPLRESIISMAEALLPERFTLLTVAPEQMPALYRSADVFLHLSKEESFGNVFLEAMGCGLPVVGHDAPRLRWIVGSSAFLIDTSDIGAIAQRIKEARLASSTLRQQRVQQAANFSWEAVAKQYQTFFAEVVATQAARHS